MLRKRLKHAKVIMLREMKIALSFRNKNWRTRDSFRNF